MSSEAFKHPKRTWRRWLFAGVGVGAVTAAVLYGRHAVQPRAEAAPPPPLPQAAAPAPAAQEPPPATPSEYTQRVVAYVYGTTPVTREQLGEYLIARLGEFKINALVNRRILEEACAARGLTVTDAEVDAQLSADLTALKVNRREFLDNYLRRRQMSLFEWREDVLRPKLMTTKLLRDQVRPSEQDLRKAFESYYGEKVVCQAIFWTKEKHQEALAVYDKIRQSAEEFDRQARLQPDGRLAAVAGLMEPFGRYGLGDDLIESETFKLREGELTPLLRSPGTARPSDDHSFVVLKLVRRIPADKVTKFEDVRAMLEKEVIDRQIQALTPETLAKLRQEANPQILLKAENEKGEGGELVREQLGRSQQPVAMIRGNVPVTREQLAEYLIARYGAERLELLVNRIIVQRACAEKKLTVSDAEVDAALAEHLKAQNLSRDLFVKEVLHSQRKTMYEFREDGLRSGLLMNKLVAPTIKAEEEELKKGFDAYYGEQFECRLILWPRSPRDREIAIKQYDLIRKSAEEFDRAARNQANPRLAAEGGKVPKFGLNGFGNENVEREVAKLREGEVTPLIETPDGYAVLRLEKRHPAQTGVKLEGNIRAQLEKEVIARKTQAMIPVEFHKLRELASPNLLLRPVLREDELLRQVEQEIGPTTQAPRK